MKEDFTGLDKIINLYYEKQKETRVFITQLDNLYKIGHNIEINKEIPKESEYIKSRMPLEIIMKCYAILSDITISKKHLLLSTQNQEQIYFAKLICMTIHTGLEYVENIMFYLKLNSEVKDIDSLIPQLKELYKYKSLIESVRNHSIAHIDPDFTIYYDSMQNIFKIPYNEFVENFIEVIQYIQKLGSKINNNQLKELRKQLKEITVSNIEIIRNDTTQSNKQELLRIYEECYEFFNLKDV